jgi:hypothetical protein
MTVEIKECSPKELVTKTESILTTWAFREVVKAVIRKILRDC